MENRIEKFANAICDRINATTLISIALDCTTDGVARFIGDKCFTVLASGENGTFPLDRVLICEIFMCGDGVRYMGVTQRNGIPVVVDGDVSSLPCDYAEQIMRNVVESVFGVDMHDIPSVSASLAAWRLLVGSITSDLPNLMSIDQAINCYPMESVGEWASNNDIQKYIDDCRNRYKGIDID